MELPSPPPVSGDWTAAADPPAAGTPTWGVVDFYPRQGEWSEADYFALDVGRQIDFCDGVLEFLPMPTFKHQKLVDWLAAELRKALDWDRVATSLYRLRIRPGKYRQADVIATRDESAFTDDYATAADLVIEVLSPGTKNRERDEVTKRAEYAEARVPEYWIVDPAGPRVEVLRLSGGEYETAGVYEVDAVVECESIDGFRVAVADLLALVGG